MSDRTTPPRPAIAAASPPSEATAQGPGRRAYSEGARAGALDRINRRRRSWGPWLEWAKVFQVAILCSLLVRAIVVEAFKIPSGSMERTLLIGDYLLVNKLAYGAEVPFTGSRLPPLAPVAHGDVIVFQWPEDPDKHFVKRVVAVAGDTVAMRRGQLLRNGRSLDERYAQHTDLAADPSGDEFRWQREFLARQPTLANPYRPSRNTWGPLVVPREHVFVLGDNRDNSLDSRYWGFVPDSMIRGRPLFVYFSFAPDSLATGPWLSRIRWARLGERIE
jgi:signal peptidase I